MIRYRINNIASKLPGACGIGEIADLSIQAAETYKKLDQVRNAIVEGTTSSGKNDVDSILEDLTFFNLNDRFLLYILLMCRFIGFTGGFKTNRNIARLILKHLRENLTNDITLLDGAAIIPESFMFHVIVRLIELGLPCGDVLSRCRYKSIDEVMLIADSGDPVHREALLGMAEAMEEKEDGYIRTIWKVTGMFARGSDIEKALIISNGIKDQRARAYALYEISSALHHRGDRDRSSEVFSQALSCADQCGQWIYGRRLVVLAGAAREKENQGDLAASKKILNDTDVNDEIRAIHGRMNGVGMLQIWEDLYDASRGLALKGYFGYAIAVLMSDPDEWSRCYNLINLSALLFEMKNEKCAVEAMEMALDGFRSSIAHNGEFITDTARHASNIAAGFLDIDELDKGLSIYNEYDCEALLIGKSIFTRALSRYHARLGDARETMVYFNKLERHDEERDGAFGDIIIFLGKAGHIDEAAKIIDDGLVDPSIQDAGWSKLSDSPARAGKLKEAIRILSRRFRGGWDSVTAGVLPSSGLADCVRQISSAVDAGVLFGIERLICKHVYRAASLYSIAEKISGRCDATELSNIITECVIELDRMDPDDYHYTGEKTIRGVFALAITHLGIEQSLALSGLSKNALVKDLALRLIAETCAAAGNRTKAVEIIDSIENSYERVSGFLQAAGKMHDAGSDDESLVFAHLAMNTVGIIDDVDDKLLMLSDLAKHFAIIKEYATVREVVLAFNETARTKRHSYTPSQLLSGVFARLIQDDAKHMVDGLIPDLIEEYVPRVDIAVELVKAGQFESGLTFIKTMNESERWYVLEPVVVLLASHNSIAQAHGVIDGITEVSSPDVRLKIAQELVNRGDKTGAMEAARLAINDIDMTRVDGSSIRTLIDISLLFTQIDEPVRSKKVLRDALDLAAKAEGKLRSKCFAAAATALAQQGRIAEAMGAIDLITDKEEKADSLWHVALFHSKNGEMETALRIMINTFWSAGVMRFITMSLPPIQLEPFVAAVDNVEMSSEMRRSLVDYALGETFREPNSIPFVIEHTIGCSIRDMRLLYLSLFLIRLYFIIMDPSSEYIDKIGDALGFQA